MSSVLARAVVAILGLVVAGVGVLGLRDPRPDWVGMVFYLLIGGVLVWEALFSSATEIRESVANNARLGWGLGLALPSGVVLAMSRLLHVPLHAPWLWLVVLAGLAGVFVLLFDMP